MVIDTTSREGMESALAHLMGVSVPELYQYIEAAADSAVEGQWCFNQDLFDEAMENFYSDMIEQELPDEILFFHLSRRLKQISESDVNELTSNALLEFALELINVYDINGDSHFLDLAGHMLDMLCEYIEDEIILLNRLQIKERRNCLEDEDIRILDELSSDNSFVLFGKSVLLKNFEQAERYYNALTSEDKKRYAGYPIYKLFERLKH